MTKFIVKTVEIVFIGLLSIILLAMGVSMAGLVFDGVIAFIVGVVTLGAIIGGIVIFKGRIKEICSWANGKLSKLSPAKMMLLLFVFSTVTKVFFVFLFDNNADLHPDMAMYRSYASQFAKQGCITENTDYALKYKYTVIYGLFLSPFAKLFGYNTKVFTTVLSVLNSISLVLVFDILKKIVNTKVVFAVLMTYCCLPFGMFQTQLLIHENGLLFFHILAFWLFLKALEKEKPMWLQAVCMVLASMSIATGKSMNAAGRVVVVSFCIFLVANLFKSGIDKKRFLCFLLALVCLVGSYVGASLLTEKIVESKVLGFEEKPSDTWPIPYGWGMYLGWNYEFSGEWNPGDKANYDKLYEFDTIEESHEYQKKIISERLKEYNVFKVVNHLFNKVKLLFGTQELPFRYEQGSSISLYIGGSVFYKGLRLINNCSFLIMYSFILISKIKKFKKNNYNEVAPTLHCQMVIIGVTLALLLFEVMPKYSSHLHILFFMILALSVKPFFESESKELKEKSC